MRNRTCFSGTGFKWIAAITLCTAAAALCVFLHAVTTPVYTLSGAQLEEADGQSAGEKMQTVLGIAGTQSNGTGQDDAGKININLADAETLQTLPGIGERLAQRIVEYRRYNGPFEKIEDILLVSGIGQAKFQALCALITV